MHGPLTRLDDTRSPLSDGCDDADCMPMRSDAALYERGASTLLASWEEYARGTTGASIQRFPGVVAVMFPDGSEREVYNNALFERGLPETLRDAAIGAMEAAYTAASASDLGR